MKKLANYVIITLCAFVMVACQKELSLDSTTGGSGGPGGGGGGGGTNSVIGTWKFVELSAKTENTVEATDGVDTEKAITVSQYTSTDNVGTITFTSNKMISTGIGYKVNTTARAYFYINGALEDSVDAPFTFTLPPSNGEGPYRQVNSDSLYFESGFFGIPGSGAQPTQAGGVRIKFEGDKLIMYSNADQTNSVNSGGVNTSTRNKLNGIITLQKQ